MGATRRSSTRSARAAARPRAGPRRRRTGPGPAGAASAARALTLCTLAGPDGPSLGVRTEAGILDVARAARARRVRVPATPDDVVRGEDLAGLTRLLARDARTGRFFVPEGDARFGPCITSPEKIVMMGFNYHRHVAEVRAEKPAFPVFFNKYNNALLGHGGTIRLPTGVAAKFDYEAELVLVIGREARDVPPAEALSYVWGYATGNDFSARDLQFKTSQFMLGKTSDGFAPLGPWLVPAQDVPDPQDLRIECRVNGELRQSSSTRDMIFSCAELVSYASRHFTLKPCDLLFTGTPEGVILGKPEAEQVWLAPGDRIATVVGDLGELRFDLA